MVAIRILYLKIYVYPWYECEKQETLRKKKKLTLQTDISLKLLCRTKTMDRI